MIFDTRKKSYKSTAILTLFAMVWQIMFPAISLAQAGPTQQEAVGYTHTSAGENVDNFTGDFTYGIPVMDIEGYPLVLSYNSNVTMTQEASWVGLGWNLNPGSIARQMRGLPDEFNGEDEIQRVQNKKPVFVGGKKNGYETGGSVSALLTGGVGISGGSSIMIGKYYNNYTGFGNTVDLGQSIGISAGIPISGEDSKLGVGAGVGFGWGISYDSQNGIGINPNLNFGLNGGLGDDGQIGLGYSGSKSWNINSREGLKSSMYNASIGGSVQSQSYKGWAASGGYSRGNTSYKSFGTQTHIPKLDYSTTGISNVRRKAGGSYGKVIGFGSTTMNGVKEKYVSISSLTLSIESIPAYGYNNLELAEYDPSGIMDFNREKERVFSKEMSSLPFTNVTYDLYNINSPGISSQFRAYRNDVGTLSDREAQNLTNSTSLSTAKSFGLLFKSVRSEGIGGNSIDSGDWDEASDYNLFYTNQTLNTNGAESFYFKRIGEKTPTNRNLYNNYYANTPVKLGVEEDASNHRLYTLNSLIPDEGASIAGPSQNFQTERVVRGQSINYYRNDELSLLNEEIINDFEEYELGGDGNPVYSAVIDDYRKDHHFGKMEVTNESGMVFGYGLPTYNISESDVVFNVEPTTAPVKGLVEYDLTDNTVDNIKGRDHFYEKRTVPAYPHSYLITDMKSSNYVDKTNDGMTPDDIGSYVKFNYSRIYGNNDPYKWRFPVSKESPSTVGYPKSSFNEGHLVDELDDKGLYSYGEKEVWFPHSIETKNYVLEFYLEDRKDAYPVKGENGELDLSKPSKCLKKMVLYARNDRKRNGASALPLKTVEFHYDYSLCKNNPSNENSLAGGNFSQSGKLTLKSITFTSGNSKIQEKSPYVFSYESQNPDYNTVDVDRWGNYKEEDPTKSNLYFPYSEQDETTANTNIKAWKLNQILYPTGGGMKVEYEADRYAKIQDQDVMRHYQIVGMSNFSNLINNLELSPADNYLSVGLLTSSQFRENAEIKRPNNVIYFKLDEPITGLSRDAADEELAKRYFIYEDNGQARILDELYFRTNVKIKEGDAVNEFIPGFAKIKQNIEKSDREYKEYKSSINALTSNSFTERKGIGVVGGTSGDYHYGYVVVEALGIKDKVKGDKGWKKKGYDVHPMQKNAWNYVRANIPWKIYAECVDVDGNPSIDDCDYGLGTDWKTIFGGGISKVLNKNGYCKEVNGDLSTIRLMDSRNFKFGGNARVKSVTYFDDWDNMSAELESAYTLEYDYDDFENKVSGVAAYEPIAGGDENSFFQPRYFNIENILKPDEQHYQIDPIAESVFPSPTVGYKHVQIKFKDRDNLTRNATGVSSFEYNTYADYPTLVKTTDLTPEEIGREKDGDLNYYLIGVSQGFVVELNDMHGQIKRSKVLDANGEEVSETVYDYFNFYDEQQVVDRYGNVSNQWIGKEIDIYADRKEVEENEYNFTGTELIDINLGIPSVNKSTNKYINRNNFYAVTLNKVINHTAILKEVKTTYLGQYSKSFTVAYDKYSGHPITTTVVDEFDENNYNFTIPAHWRYHELRPRYKNQRLMLENIDVGASGEVTGLSEVASYFSRGDILLLQNASGDQFKASVIETDSDAGSIKLIEDSGDPFPAMSDLYLLNLRSGFKNRIVEGMATYILKKNPIVELVDPGDSPIIGTVTIENDKILAANAVEYIENRARVCEAFNLCGIGQNSHLACADPVETDNPFKYGFVGNWKPYRSYAFQGDRVNNNSTDYTNLKNDGRIASFIPFYANVAGKWRSIVESDHPNFVSVSDYQQWRPLDQVTRYDRYGHGVESRSQLGIYTSVLYGYNNNLKSVPIATAVNAKVSQIAFDGFEDYSYLNDDVACENTGHFDFKDAVFPYSIVKEERHTGNYSLMTHPGQSFEVVRRMEECKGIPDIECDCEPKFSPSKGKYVIGVWIKEANSKQKLMYENAKVQVEVVDNGGVTVGTAYEFSPTGEIVDGWQRLEGVFTIAEDGDFCIRVALKNEGQNQMYFDDLRIHPFVSAMSSTVYDDELLLPMAQLNGYNFATFFMYDEDLQQVRVRQETERGIYTIQESKVGIHK